jgi:peptidoglycan/xylan/chitin deacetylase (PgdA/CDA1 family)
VEAFMDDFAAASDKIEEIAGVKPDIFRFPGGSVNSYNETWGNTIISEMLSRGYRYYDWNVGSGDTAADTDAGMIYEAVIKQVHSNSYSVVLMHDGGGNRSQTVQALPLIIDRLLREGYHFDRLTNQVKPTVFAAASLSRG